MNGSGGMVGCEGGGEGGGETNERRKECDSFLCEHFGRAGVRQMAAMNFPQMSRCEKKRKSLRNACVANDSPHFISISVSVFGHCADRIFC